MSVKWTASIFFSFHMVGRYIWLFTELTIILMFCFECGVTTVGHTNEDWILYWWVDKWVVWGTTLSDCPLLSISSGAHLLWGWGPLCQLHLERATTPSLHFNNKYFLFSYYIYIMVIIIVIVIIMVIIMVMVTIWLQFGTSSTFTNIIFLF